MIPCKKGHDKGLILYYRIYDIPKAILDLNPDFCQHFLFFITLLILLVEICMIPLWKAVNKGFISVLHLRALSNLWGSHDFKTKNMADFRLVTVSFVHIQSGVIPLLKSLIEIVISSSYTVELPAIYGDVVAKKHENWWPNCAMCSLTELF